MICMNNWIRHALIVLFVLAGAGRARAGLIVTDTSPSAGYGFVEPGASLGHSSLFYGHVVAGHPPDAVFSYTIPALVNGKPLDSVLIHGFDVGGGSIVNPFVYLNFDQSLYGYVYDPVLHGGVGQLVLDDFALFAPGGSTKTSAIDTLVYVPVSPGVSYTVGTMDFIQDGQVVGSEEVLVAGVPEPSTIIAASVGVLMGLGCTLRRRRGKRAEEGGVGR